MSEEIQESTENVDEGDVIDVRHLTSSYRCKVLEYSDGHQEFALNVFGSKVQRMHHAEVLRLAKALVCVKQCIENSSAPDVDELLIHQMIDKSVSETQATSGNPEIVLPTESKEAENDENPTASGV